LDTEEVKNPVLGILLVIIAILGFSILSGFVKAASNAGLPTQEIVFLQSLVALIIQLPWILRGGRQVLVPKNKILIVGRSLCGLTFLYLFFLAVKLVPLVNAVLLQNTVPLFIPILTFLIFRKKITTQVLAGIVIGFIGIVLVLDPGRGFLRPGDLIALSAGFISAVGTILLGRLEDKGETVPTIMLYYLVITMVVTGIWSIHAWKAPQGIVWLYLVSAGIFYTAYQVLLMLSLKQASPVIISPFLYLGVVFSGLVDWVVWKQSPGPMTVIGVVVVIVGAVLSIVHRGRGGQNEEKRQRNN